MERFDVCVIGGGILGCLTARELAQCSLSCVLAEKREDLCLEISKVNTAVLYPGYDNKPGTMKSRFAVEGNRLTASACEELGVPIDRCGSLMAAKGPAGERILLKKFEQGMANHVPGLRMMDRQEIQVLEPSLSSEVTKALFAPGTAVIYPWRLGMAAAKEASLLGAVVRLGTEVCEIRTEAAAPCKYVIVTHSGEEFAADCVINAAGMAADKIRELLFAPKYRIRPSKADYLVCGREENPGLSHVVFYEPEDGLKGITLVPGLNGTILAGASRRPYAAGKQPAGAVPFETESETSAGGLSFIRDRVGQICPSLALSEPIRSFAGLRPEPYEVMPDSLGHYADTGRSIRSFVIEQEGADGSFISLLGIKTPGITASVPIAKYVADMAAQTCRGMTSVQVKKAEAGEKMTGVPDQDQGKSLKRAAAGSGERVICRCEKITESEIRKAVRDGAVSVEGVKLRCNAGMGKCQGARCRRDVERILEEELNGRTTGRTAPTDLPDAKSRPVQETSVECGLLIIGAGAAGLSLAAQLKDEDPETDILIVDREEAPGGVLLQCLHEGFPESDQGKMLDGPAYAGLLRKEVSGRNIRCLFGTHVMAISEEEEFVYADASSLTGRIRIRARQAVIACGAIERTAGMMMIPGSRPRGVYSAGEAQRMLNLEGRLPGKRAVVVGAGNMGLIVSDLMIRRGMDVVRILEKEDHVTALRGNIRKYLESADSVIGKDLIGTGKSVARICGEKNLKGVVVSPGGEFLPCDTLVIAAGLIPDRQLLHESGLHGESEKVFLFGNCDRIWESVSAIRKAAKKKANYILLTR